MWSGCTSGLLEMILGVALTLLSELPCLSDTRPPPGLAGNSSCSEAVPSAPGLSDIPIRDLSDNIAPD